MGLPSQAFKADYYRSRRRTSHGAGSTGAAPRPSNDYGESSSGRNTLGRRLSTGTLSVVGHAEAERKAAGSVTPTDAASSRTSSTDKPFSRRGRRSRANSATSVRGSGMRSPSANSAVEEEERARRRQLILAARPGGTGMVTLPDGTKVRARRVGDPDTDGEDVEWPEWGFAGLAKSKRQEAGAAGKSSSAAGQGEAQGEDAAAGPTDSSEAPTLVADDRDGSSDQVDAGGRAEVDSQTDSMQPRTEGGSTTDSIQETLRKPSLTGLSAQRAEEVKRRHEAEMAALGAEVLAAHRRKVESANAAAGLGNATPESPRTSAGGEDMTGSKEFSKVRSKDTLRGGRDERRERSSMSSLRPTRSPGSPTLSASPVGSTRSPLGSQKNASTSRFSLGSFTDRLRSPSESRLGMSNVAYYSPMGNLPRKPDAKGYVVVPLPSELGQRPERPLEGRFWAYSDSDSDLDLPEDGGAASRAKGKRAQGADEDEDEDEDELDEEEMAEEERRKVAHSKRATTTAAGLERMHVRARTGSGHANSNSASATASINGSGSPTMATADAVSVLSRAPRRSQTLDAGASTGVAGASIDRAVLPSTLRGQWAQRSQRNFSDGSRTPAAEGSGSGGPTRRRAGSMSAAQGRYARRRADGLLLDEDGLSERGSELRSPSAGGLASTDLDGDFKGKSKARVGSNTRTTRTASPLPSATLRNAKSTPSISKRAAGGGAGAGTGTGTNTEDDDLDYWPVSVSQMLGFGTGMGTGYGTGGASARGRTGSNAGQTPASVMLAQASRVRAAREKRERQRARQRERERAAEAAEAEGGTTKSSRARGNTTRANGHGYSTAGTATATGKTRGNAPFLASTSMGNLPRVRPSYYMNRRRSHADRTTEVDDDDALDYGWPPTLKGSLYDR